jgi:hypothetical protein
MLQAGRSRFRFPKRSLNFFNLLNPSSRNMALGSTQPLTEMSTRNVPGGKRAADAQVWQPYRHLWVDCLDKMWEPRRLTILWVSTACYRDSFTFYLLPRPYKFMFQVISPFQVLRLIFCLYFSLIHIMYSTLYSSDFIYLTIFGEE